MKEKESNCIITYNLCNINDELIIKNGLFIEVQVHVMYELIIYMYHTKDY